MDNIDNGYDRFAKHPNGCRKKASSFKSTKRCRHPETFELIRNCGAEPELKSELAKFGREATRGDAKKRKRAVLPAATEAEKGIRYTVWASQSSDKDDCLVKSVRSKYGQDQV
ncbi:hypothetical protein RB195_006601 [Necator americanus]|uniref:Uncharacterized protein n=1 Tax=Necator americanus TaxID=51031 RepID=A0ABR1BWA0_NECAM